MPDSPGKKDLPAATVGVSSRHGFVLGGVMLSRHGRQAFALPLVMDSSVRARRMPVKRFAYMVR